MAGSKEGGVKTRETNIRKYGADYYSRLGQLGGKAKVPKGFALNRELASRAGQKGGRISRKPKRTVEDIFV